MALRLWIAAFGFIACLLGQPAFAGQLQDAQAAYESKDYLTAARLWKLLANDGNMVAQSNLGLLYDFGWGVPQDYTEALVWYRKAAAKGSSSAQFRIGTMYFDGKGVPQNIATAFKWYQLAASQGEGRAQAVLGDMYNIGKGVPQDFVLSHMWLNLASVNYIGDANMRSDIIKLRDSTARKMTPDQIAKAQKLAREWVAAHSAQ